MPNNDIYYLKEKEEHEYLFKINNLINDLENQLKLISNPHSYLNIIILEKNASNLLLELILKKSGHQISVQKRFTDNINFCKDYRLINSKIAKYLHNIRRLRNQTVHADSPTYQQVLHVQNNFNEVLKWITENYLTDNNGVKLLQIETFSKIVKSLPKTVNMKSEDMIFSPIMQGKDINYLNMEVEFIKSINQQLSYFENQLKDILNESVYYTPVISGEKICELMLQLYLQKSGYNFENIKKNYFSAIRFCSLNNILPNECRKFINSIRIYRNKLVHSEPSYNLILSYLKALNYFLLWFNNYYAEIYQTKKQFNVENCCLLINLLPQDINEAHAKLNIELYSESINLLNENYQQSNQITQLEKQINENQIYQQSNQITQLEDQIEQQRNQITQLEKQINKKQIEQQKNQIKFEKLLKRIIYEQQLGNAELLYRLDKQDDNFTKILNKQDEVIIRLERIENEFDEIRSEITSLQSLAKQQIDNTTSDEEIERIIANFTNKYINTLKDYIHTLKEDYIYEEEKIILKNLLEEDAWNKLTEKSKNFLISSRVMFRNYNMTSKYVDYSGVCVLVTKALEVELNKRFITNFLNFLDSKYPNDFSKYHSSLLSKYNEPLPMEKFSMGSMAYIMCYYKTGSKNSKKNKNNKRVLMEYCKKHLFSEYTEKEIDDKLKEYASTIEYIRKEYRNPSAHTNDIRKSNAQECFNLVLDVEKLLKKMLESFDE